MASLLESEMTNFFAECTIRTKDGQILQVNAEHIHNFSVKIYELEEAEQKPKRTDFLGIDDTTLEILFRVHRRIQIQIRMFDLGIEMARILIKAAPRITGQQIYDFIDKMRQLHEAKKKPTRIDFHEFDDIILKDLKEAWTTANYNLKNPKPSTSIQVSDEMRAYALLLAPEITTEQISEFTKQAFDQMSSSQLSCENIKGFNEETRDLLWNILTKIFKNLGVWHEDCDCHRNCNHSGPYLSIDHIEKTN